MKFKINCLLIVVTLFCSKITADTTDPRSDSDDDECIKEYLQHKGKIKSDLPVRPSTLYCRFTAATYLRIILTITERDVKDIIPNDAECLLKEFKSQEVLDVILKMKVIAESQLNDTRNELRKDLSSIALKCRTDEKKYIEIFNIFLGIENANKNETAAPITEEESTIKNVTLSASEHYYCFAKYTADNKLLRLENVELNPNVIAIVNIKCDAIIKEELERFENELSEKIDASPMVIACIIKEMKNVNFFDTHISLLVLNYFEFPKETENEERSKLNYNFAKMDFILFYCAEQGATADT